MVIYVRVQGRRKFQPQMQRNKCPWGEYTKYFEDWNLSLSERSVDPAPGTKKSDIKCRFEKISFFRYWFPLIIYCILIFWQSSFPSIESIPELLYSDKLLHFFAYAVLGALFLRAYRTLRIRDNLKLLILLSILSYSLYGISDELHQYFVPSRSAEWMDIFADVLGSVFGVFIYQYFTTKFTDNRFKSLFIWIDFKLLLLLVGIMLSVSSGLNECRFCTTFP